MALDLANYETMAREAVMAFWGNRAAAAKKQKEADKSDQGGRSAVTAGKNMDGFVAIIEKNGLAAAEIHQQRRVLTLPGYYRPTKLWDRRRYPPWQAHRSHRTEKPGRSLLRQ